MLFSLAWGGGGGGGLFDWAYRDTLIKCVLAVIDWFNEHPKRGGGGGGIKVLCKVSERRREKTRGLGG